MKNASPFSTGGGGVTYEQRVSAYYMVKLLAQYIPNGLRAGITSSIQFQARQTGAEVDDLIVTSNDGTIEYRVLLQIKHKFTFTDNTVFQEFIKNAWNSYNKNKSFKPDYDSIGIVVPSYPGNVHNHLIPMLETARTSISSNEFINKIETSCSSSNHTREYLKIFRNALDKSAGSNIGDEQIWNFLKCFKILQIDVENDESSDSNYLFNTLIDLIPNKKTELAHCIFNELINIAGAYGKRAGTINRQALQGQLYTDIPSLRPQTDFFSEMEIKLQSISSVFVPPKEYDQAKTNLYNRRIVILIGPPHIGKTATAYKLALDIRNENDNHSIISINFDEKLSTYKTKVNNILILDDFFGDVTYSTNHNHNTLNDIFDLSKLNFIIITSRTDIFRQAQQKTRLNEQNLSAIIELNPESSYRDESLQNILEKHLEFEKQNSRLSEGQIILAQQHKNDIIRELRFPHNIKFLCRNILCNIGGDLSIQEAIEQSKIIKDSVQTWTNNLLPSQQWIVFLVTLYPYTPIRDIYIIYKGIAQKNNFNPEDITHFVKSHGSYLTNTEKPSFAHPSYMQAVHELLYCDYENYCRCALLIVLDIISDSFTDKAAIARDYLDENTKRDLLLKTFRVLVELGDPGLHKRGLEISYNLPSEERDWLHDFLNYWVKNLPAEKRQSVYDYWITSLAKTLGDDSFPDKLECAIMMVITIGIRTDEIQKQLERLAGIKCKNDLTALIQDQAINALAWLGYPDEDSLIDRILQCLSSDEHSLLWLLPAVRRLTPRSLLSVILQIYKEHRDDDGAYGSLLWVIADLALAYPEEADNIWKAIEEGITPQSIYSIKMAGDVTSRIDSPLVLNYFLSQIQCPASEDDIGNTGTSPNYLIYNRMRNLSRPHQIEAYRRNNSSNLKQVLQGLRHDACNDTGKDAEWETVSMRLKKMAWDIALRLNMDGITDWFPEAMEDANSFVQGDIAELAGFIRATSAIPSLRKCASRKDINFIPGMAVIHALGNIGTRESFDALMDCNIRIGNNKVPQDLPDSIACATLQLNDCGQLLNIIETNSFDPDIRMACAAALEQVAFERPGIVEPIMKRIITLLSHPDILPTHVDIFLLGALGYVEKNSDAIDILLQFAHKGGDTGTRALESLARWDILADHNDLLEVMGLKKKDNCWILEKKPDERESFIIGLLYAKHSVQFSRAVVRILEESGYYEAKQVMGILMTMNHDMVDTDVINALVKRIFDSNKNGRVEHEMFDTLASISPDTFVHELRYEVSSHWAAPARESIVSSLRRIKKTESTSDLVDKTLRQFLVDDVPSIRRMAAIALSERNIDVLCEEAQHLLNSNLDFERECGIQAACWIKDENSFQPMLTKARHDIAKNVRIAAFDGFRDRQDRRLANNYLDHVLSDVNDVLGVWHYGQALRDYGDGETLRRLVVASNDTTYTPNKRDWLIWIAKGVQKRWSELEQKRNER